MPYNIHKLDAEMLELFEENIGLTMLLQLESWQDDVESLQRLEKRANIFELRCQTAIQRKEDEDGDESIDWENLVYTIGFVMSSLIKHLKAFEVFMKGQIHLRYPEKTEDDFKSETSSMRTLRPKRSRHLDPPVEHPNPLSQFRFGFLSERAREPKAGSTPPTDPPTQPLPPTPADPKQQEFNPESAHNEFESRIHSVDVAIKNLFNIVPAWLEGAPYVTHETIYTTKDMIKEKEKVHDDNNS